MNSAVINDFRLLLHEGNIEDPTPTFGLVSLIALRS